MPVQYSVILLCFFFLWDEFNYTENALTVLLLYYLSNASANTTCAVASGPQNLILPDYIVLDYLVAKTCISYRLMKPMINKLETRLL